MFTVFPVSVTYLCSLSLIGQEKWETTPKTPPFFLFNLLCRSFFFINKDFFFFYEIGKYWGNHKKQQQQQQQSHRAKGRKIKCVLMVKSFSYCCVYVCVLPLTYNLWRQIFILLGIGLNYQVHVIAIMAHASVMSRQVY